VKEDTKPGTGQEIVEDDSTSGKSLTRKAALGLGAAAVGGAALGELANAGGAQAATKATVPDGAVFKKVLTKMAAGGAEAAAYRKSILDSPGNLTKQFPSLTMLQLEALRNCAILSGVNISSINKVRAAAISTTGNINQTGAIVVGGSSGGPGHSVGWTISCTCCCCCCCGEAAVVVRP
jgi:hypothetical protein